nr:hypothetical protein [Tanacetum cinerariifolium]
MCQSNQQVNMVNPSCETCGGLHHYFECQAASGFTQGDIYAATGNYNMGAGPSVPPPNPLSFSKEVKRDLEPIMDQVHIPCSESTIRVSSSVIQPATASKPNEIPEPNPNQPPIPYPSSFAEALAQMPKYAKMLKDLLTNKEKLLELANTPRNENSSAVAYLAGIAEDVFVQVGKFTFPVDFVVVDYNVDPLGDEKLVFNVESTLEFPHKHGDESINQIDITNTTCE